MNLTRFDICYESFGVVIVNLMNVEQARWLARLSPRTALLSETVYADKCQPFIHELS
jgi:hypothetical protein